MKFWRIYFFGLRGAKRRRSQSYGEHLQRCRAKKERDKNHLVIPRRVYTIAGYCNLHKIPCPLHQAKEWGKNAAALSRQKAIPTGTAHDERYGQVRTYHEDILKEVVV